jgi:hypothetical protein
MRFDEALAVLVEHCASVAPSLGSAGYAARSARTNTYGCDIWVPQVARAYLVKQMSPDEINEYHFGPFYDAAWELCRIGVLRPGEYAPGGTSMSHGFKGDGYAITDFGKKWLADIGSRPFLDPSRMMEMFAAFAPRFTPGYAQRAAEAIRCHRTGNYLAACVMAGAAAESILLAVAIVKTGDEAKVLKDYGSSGGRGRVTKLVLQGLAGSVARQFEAALLILHYWRDDASHGMATTITEVEAHASLTQLLRLAQFTSDQWGELTA